jgi:hypothetical protein
VFRFIGELYFDSFAKLAVAFFRMSRIIFSLATTLRTVSSVPMQELEYISAMRIWLVLILSASFALQGWASTRISSVSCDMGIEVAAPILMSDGSAQTAALDVESDDCCNDTATFLRTGQLCKTGQDCHVPVSAFLVSPPQGTATHLSLPVPAASTPAELLALPFAVWRPPTSS